MAGGWAGDNAVNDQIASSIEDAVAHARSRIPQGKSLTVCQECEEKIPKARQEALPGVQLCIVCQEENDKLDATITGYNRKGSKDSQLR